MMIALLLIELPVAVGAFLLPPPMVMLDCEQQILRWHAEVAFKEGSNRSEITSPRAPIVLEATTVSPPTLERLCEYALASLLPGSAAEARSTRSEIAAVTSGNASYDAKFALILAMNEAGESRAVLQDAAFNTAEPLVQFERARALLLNANYEMGATTLEHAVRTSRGAAALLYYYSEPILSSSEREEAGNTAVDSLGSLLMEAWKRRASQAGLTLGERLAVHFQRRLHADTMYWSRGRSEQDSLTAVELTRIDPRWPLYIRFGAPWKEVHTPYILRNGMSGEFLTWAYLDPHDPKPILFHFSGVYARYTLSNPPPCTFPGWYSDRVNLSPFIGQLYNACLTRSKDQTGRTQDLRRRTQETYRQYAERDFVNPTRPGPKFTYALYQFAANPAGSTSEVVAVAAVRNEAPARMGAGLFLRATHDSKTFDAIGPLATAGETHIFLSTVISALREGDYDYRVRVADSTFSSGFVYGGSYTVRGIKTTGIDISDIVIAHAGTGNVLKRGNESLTPILGEVLDPTFRLYFELYGIATNGTMHMEIEITRDGGIFRRNVALKLEFDETVSAGAITGVRRDISHGLRPGEYELTVRTRSPDGRIAAERTTSIRIGRR